MSVRFPWPPGSILRSRLAAALASTLSAAAVAVVINVWTDSWTWPIGISLAALLLMQTFFEWNRGGGAAGALPASSPTPTRLRVDQSFADVTDSDITAVRCAASAGSDVEVVQRLGAVDRSTVVGIDGNSSR